MRYLITVQTVMAQYVINLGFGIFKPARLDGCLQINKIAVQVMSYPPRFLIGIFPFCSLLVAQSYLLFIDKILLFRIQLAAQFVIYVKYDICLLYTSRCV